MLYPETNATAKIGVNYIRNIFERNNHIFNEIHPPNDVGIDAIINIVINKVPSNIMIGIQIKSGDSYFRDKSNLCSFPVNGHYNYWKKHILPVYGMVYLPCKKLAYWVDIKNYINNNKDCSNIIVELNEYNKFDNESFKNIFSKLIMCQPAKLSFSEAKKYCESRNSDERIIGLQSLYYNHSDKMDTWIYFIDLFKRLDISKIEPLMIYYISHIPSHQDIMWRIGPISSDIRDKCKKLISEFTYKEMIKLYYFIDIENSIQRGSIGQSVESISKLIKNESTYLEKIIADSNSSNELRSISAQVYAYRKQKASLPFLLKNKDIANVDLVISMIKEYGYIDFY